MLDLVHDVVADEPGTAHIDEDTALGGDHQAVEPAHAQGMVPLIAPAELLSQIVLQMRARSR